MRLPHSARALSIIALLFMPLCVQAVNQKLDDELTQRCLGTFDFIKTQDLAAFIALMPYAPTQKEQEYAGEILQRSHKRWYVDRTMDEITPKGVSYSQADEFKRQKGAIQEARVKLLITSPNEQASVSCKFVETQEGWFLSKLP
ncbi:hypothetical protein ACRN9O_09165 [Shewanella oncorhynchi]|uniref:hypothetical protein n=1 Tax=Shewanella TaxID=22 RepID=UPI0021D9E992|nr:hypothetical protein [Shewanella sp. SM23]MCU8084498.1 hypothetical protein [Shewanella sp. SM23]